MTDQAQDVREPMSATHVMGVKFYPDNMDSNFRGLLAFFELSEEQQVAELVASFSIVTDGSIENTEVGAGKYKSAILLLALATSFGKDTFTLTPQNRALVKNYFPTELVQEAIANPDTEHITIRRLLVGDNVTVKIKRPPQD